jgi:CheY-like chemotaxis protein
MLESHGQQPIRALIAEHHPATRRYLRRCLKAAGCSVDQVFNGADALVKIHDESPDLAFLDLSLPVLDGLTVLADLRLLAPFVRTKFIVLYRAQHPEMLNQAMRYGIFDFLATPLKEERLQKLIAVALQFIHVWNPAHEPAELAQLAPESRRPLMSRG